MKTYCYHQRLRQHPELSFRREGSKKKKSGDIHILTATEPKMVARTGKWPEITQICAHRHCKNARL